MNSECRPEVDIDLSREVADAKAYCQRFGDPGEPWQDYVDWKGIMYANKPGVSNPTHAVIDGVRYKLTKWGPENLIDGESDHG